MLERQIRARTLISTLLRFPTERLAHLPQTQHRRSVLCSQGGDQTGGKQTKVADGRLSAQVREDLYQTLGCLVRCVGGFYACTNFQAPWVAALTDCLDFLHTSHIRMIIRHIMIPMVKTCPENQRCAQALGGIRCLSRRCSHKGSARFVRCRVTGCADKRLWHKKAGRPFQVLTGHLCREARSHDAWNFRFQR